MKKVLCKDSNVYSFWPENAAFIIIDMQREFVDPEGGLTIVGRDQSHNSAIIPKIKSVLEATRLSSITIVHTREGFDSDLSNLSPLLKEVEPNLGQEGPLGRMLIRGECGHNFIDELTPNLDELVIEKHTHSVFTQTELDAELKKRGITHLVITGVTTECCVASSIRDAVDLGYYILTLEDCCAGSDPNIHDDVFKWISYENTAFGWVSDSLSFLRSLNE